MHRNPARAIDPRVLDEAADWLMQLHDSAASDADRAACERWRQSHPEHARAWARAELLLDKLGGLPAPLAAAALQRPAHGSQRRARRAALAGIGKLAALLAVAPAGWGAAHRTTSGARRDVRLADGSSVTLNTASAIDVRFDRAQRLVLLRAGEILVQTAPDTAASHRPFRVATLQGRMQALGTRFTVRQEDGRSRVAVLEGAVRIEPLQGAPLVLRAGQQSWFGSGAVAAPEAADAGATAWTQGMLLADGMRLADVAAELSRYRRGVVQCDPAIADLRVSGAFPMLESERALTMLVSTYEVQAYSRLGGLWVTLAPR